MTRSLALLSFIALAGCSAAQPPASSPGYASAAAPPSPSRPAGEVAAAQSVTVSESSKVVPGVAAFFTSDAPSAPAAPPPRPPPTPHSIPPTQPAPPSTNQAARERGMLVYTAKITLSVYQVEQGLERVEQIAKDTGGYLSVRNDRDITVRVPRERFEEALTAIDKVGDVLHRDVEAQDVTDAYVDMEIRIKNAQAMQTRLKALLDKASVKESLELEKELKRVTEELELLEGKLKVMSARIAFSTVTVMFEPHGAALTSSKVSLPFPWLGALGLPSLLRLTESK